MDYTIIGSETNGSTLTTTIEYTLLDGSTKTLKVFQDITNDYTTLVALAFIEAKIAEDMAICNAPINASKINDELVSYVGMDSATIKSTINAKLGINEV
jgi:hypothetical protein